MISIICPNNLRGMSMFFLFFQFVVCLLIFFYQAEDCIRYYKVTGVQTCALPISAIATKSLRERALQVALKLKENSAATLCHNDVHHLNVTDDVRLRLIDWEYSGVGQRLFDQIGRASCRERGEINRCEICLETTAS